MTRIVVLCLIAMAAGAAVAHGAFLASTGNPEPLSAQRMSDWATVAVNSGKLDVEGASSFGEGLDHVTLAVANGGGTEIDRETLAPGQHVEIDPAGATTLTVTLEFPDGSHLRDDVAVTP